MAASDGGSGRASSSRPVVAGPLGAAGDKPFGDLKNAGMHV